MLSGEGDVAACASAQEDAATETPSQRQRAFSYRLNLS